MSYDALIASGSQSLAEEIIDLVAKRHPKDSERDICMIVAMATGAVNASFLTAAGIKPPAARAVVVGCFDAVLKSLE